MKTLRIALVISLLLILTTQVASADPPPLLGPAMFLDAPDCYLVDIAWNWYYVEDCSPTISLITNSKTGVLLWHAHTQLPAGAVLPERGAYHITYENSGFACWWEEGVETTNYSITITPDGMFNINCHFRPEKWQPE
jgi:hypothetical protein